MPSPFKLSWNPESGLPACASTTASTKVCSIAAEAEATQLHIPWAEPLAGSDLLSSSHLGMPLMLLFVCLAEDTSGMLGCLPQEHSITSFLLVQDASAGRTSHRVHSKPSHLGSPRPSRATHASWAAVHPEGLPQISTDIPVLLGMSPGHFSLGRPCSYLPVRRLVAVKAVLAALSLPGRCTHHCFTCGAAVTAGRALVLMHCSARSLLMGGLQEPQDCLGTAEAAHPWCTAFECGCHLCCSSSP